MNAPLSNLKNTSTGLKMPLKMNSEDCLLTTARLQLPLFLFMLSTTKEWKGIANKTIFKEERTYPYLRGTVYKKEVPNTIQIVPQITAEWWCMIERASLPELKSFSHHIAAMWVWESCSVTFCASVSSYVNWVWSLGTTHECCED